MFFPFRFLVWLLASRSAIRAFYFRSVGGVMRTARLGKRGALAEFIIEANGR
jgi:hypothetical protein